MDELERKLFVPLIEIDGEWHRVTGAVNLEPPPKLDMEEERKMAQVRERCRRDSMVYSWLLPAERESNNR